ncbi:MerR family transcriptional regulator [Conexibacter woesei]|uniref:Transcriptional regulator, MerR family n=1 Tax=Conexibacter woesei (strain DSM 14684 / CCUG 47730 / CIP 108061 / JCM 11494 / NBRC 100937 / ID131577) TaxID=469383 RepID=D3F0T3_CONWI|nr:MerR family transcriptional regulator [Conexibacter woesei]ADB54017.1 transcriptional regulator, MerR family [Conexibacter woesei DSM 14684]
MREHDGQSYLTIGEVAEQLGVSPQTLRVWEAKELVVPDRSAGGHRLYGEQHVRRARQVVELRQRHGWNPAAILDSLGRGDRVESGETSPWRGDTIRRARRDRGLTLREAAARIGVSASFLSSVERGEVGVTTQFVARVADAFLMPMSGMASFRAQGPFVVRSDERASGTLVGGVVWEELVLPGHALEPALLTVPPARDSGGAYARPGETFVFVLAGALVFTLGDEQVRLDEGDALVVPAQTLYAWSNPGARPARAFFVEQVPSQAWSEGAAARAVARTRRHGT